MDVDEVEHTLMEVRGELQGVDELRVETRGHLDAHAAQEQPDVKGAQVWLLVPWRLVLLDEASDDGIGGRTHVDHCGGILLRCRIDCRLVKITIRLSARVETCKEQTRMGRPWAI
jgi:hypothetical protein